MKKSPLNTARFSSRNIVDLLNASAAGIAISGDSGAGKSNAIRVLVDAALRCGVGMTIVDPHGDLGRDIELLGAALPRRLRERCQVIRPSDLSSIVALNPLFVPKTQANWLSWRAQVAVKVSQMARILLYAWGERDFNSKPVLFKWLTRVLTTLATANLTIPDARHFFQVGGEVYQALANAVPDALARIEMEDLADMRPREREDLIASTKNRLIGFFENPVVELAFGRPDRWLDPSSLICNRNVTVVSLERGGVLRDEDVEIFANVWLSEILNAAYNLPPEKRTPHIVFLDELPVFASSFDILTRALTQIRKFQIRIVAAFQGTSLFPGRSADRLLNALISQCRTTVVFRHKNPADAKFFGELVTLPVIDPRAEKHRLLQTQQFQSGHDLVYLTDESDNWTDSQGSGGARADARSDSSTVTSGEIRSTGDSTTESHSDALLSRAVSRARSEQSGTSSSTATTSAASRTDSENWSTTKSRGGSRTRRMTLVPRLRWREIVSSIQFLTPEEQVTLGARDLTRLATGEAVIYTAGSPPVRVRFPLARAPFGQTPKFAAKQLRRFRNEVSAKPIFSDPETLIAERREFESRLIVHLNSLSAEQTPIRSAPQHTPIDPNPLLTI